MVEATHRESALKRFHRRAQQRRSVRMFVYQHGTAAPAACIATASYVASSIRASCVASHAVQSSYRRRRRPARKHHAARIVLPGPIWRLSAAATTPSRGWHIPIATSAQRSRARGIFLLPTWAVWSALLPGCCLPDPRPAISERPTCAASATSVRGAAGGHSVQHVVRHHVRCAGEGGVPNQSRCFAGCVVTCH